MNHSPLDLQRLDHIELFVGNAYQAAHFYRTAFGFSQIAYAGPETGKRESSSYLLEQGKIRFVVTAPILPKGEIADFVHLHGDGVQNLVFQVAQAEKVYEEAIRRGAVGTVTPRVVRDQDGMVVIATIRAYGNVVHTFLQREGYNGCFLPGYEPSPRSSGGVGLLKIDHIVANVEDKKMDTWVEYYKTIFGFEHSLSFDDKDISTKHSALRSKVMSSPNGWLRLPINEPAPGLRRSQIQEYIDFHPGPGVQHVAWLTGDIIETVTALRERGAEFLDVPDAYYETLSDRVGPIEEDLDKIRENRILVDRDDDGYLLQLFTKPVEDRPTLFYEVIQRKGSQGFGKGNFKALFESIEAAQSKRGNL